MAVEYCQSSFTRTIPHCHGNEIRDKVGICKRYLRYICVYMRVFRVGPSHAGNQILPRLSLIVMATNFGTKWASVRDICKIFTFAKEVMFLPVFVCLFVCLSVC